MKTNRHRVLISLAVTAGLLSGLLTPALAGCRYFRVSAGVLQCKEVNPADLKGLSRPETEIAELPAEAEGKLMHVDCRCGYTLYGSNPFCDFDQSQEIDSDMGTDNNANPCGSAKTFCASLCPQNLN
jgi:hypothetical protein